MSTCLCTVGHHNLITDSPEIVARQLSDIYDINIEYGSYDDEFGNSQGSIVKHEGAPLYMVWGSTDERGHGMMSAEERMSTGMRFRSVS